MAYRNGTYIAFHAGGTKNPTASDIRYYRILKMWHKNDNVEFRFINSHEKAAAVRDGSKKETLERSLKYRLNNSKNMVLIVGPTTKYDTDWVPFEIAHAIDKCGIPIILAYTNYIKVMDPVGLSTLWPPAFTQRVIDGRARAIHVPFLQGAIDDAISQFHINNLPSGPLVYYDAASHQEWGQ
jgi:SH3-like domain-containing protein